MDLILPADSTSEKNTRGRLKSAVDRAISRKRVIIVDSLNNIKGYRCEVEAALVSATDLGVVTDTELADVE
jgi:tRNA uridine 5-carbamoylmethylation protein Kti12